VLMTAAACGCVFWEEHTRRTLEALGRPASGFTLLDFALSAVAIAAVLLVAAILGVVGLGFALIAVFAILWLYPTVAEAHWGATIGKNVVHLAVVQDVLAALQGGD